MRCIKPEQSPARNADLRAAPQDARHTTIQAGRPQNVATAPCQHARTAAVLVGELVATMASTTTPERGVLRQCFLAAGAAGQPSRTNVTRAAIQRDDAC